MTHLVNLFRKMKVITIPWGAYLVGHYRYDFFFLLSCSNAPRSVETISEQFIIRDFIPIVNWHIVSAGNETRAVNCNKSLVLDYSNAIAEGFISQHKTRSGKASLNFPFP